MGGLRSTLRVPTWMNATMAITSATRPTQGRPPARQHAVRGNLNLSGVFGDKDVGDPVEYEHLRLVQTSAVVEREIFNRGIALVVTEVMRVC